MTNPTQSHMPDEQLDAMVERILAERAEEVAAVAMSPELMADRIAQRLPGMPDTTVNVRLVLVLGLVALWLVASVAALLIATRPPLPSVLVSPSPSASGDATPQPTQGPEPSFTGNPVRVDALANACDFGFQWPVAEALGLTVDASPLGPTDAPPNAVCEMYRAGSNKDLEDYVGNIHVFEPLSGQELETRANAILWPYEVVQGGLHGRDIFLGHGGEDAEGRRYSVVVIGDPNYLVMIIVHENALDPDAFVSGLTQVADAVIRAIDTDQAGAIQAQDAGLGLDDGVVDDACNLDFQTPIAQALGIDIDAQALTPPETPDGSVCDLWRAGSVDQPASDWYGAIRVYGPWTAGRRLAQLNELVGTGDITWRHASDEPTYWTDCGGGACVWIAYDNHLASISLTAQALNGTPVASIAGSLIDAIVTGIDAGTVGQP